VSGIPDDTVSVQVKTRPTTGGLKTLWIPSLWNLPKERLTLFKNLGSLKVADGRSQSEWREVLSHCYSSSKHLSLELDETSDDELSSLQPLQFLILEIMEFKYGEVFPSWMVVPSSLTLITLYVHRGLPLSHLRTFC